MAASLGQLPNRAANSSNVHDTLNNAPKAPRVSFLTDPTTSRDLFGVCRGRCTACTKCGRYQKHTSEYTVLPGQVRPHAGTPPSPRPPPAPPPRCPCR
jgi:hypothetical protein